MSQQHLLAIATSAYYAGEHDAGRRACERLLAMPLDDAAEQQVRSNRTWYTQPLHEIADCVYQRFDIEPANEGWSLFNPTIMAHGGRLVAIVRSSNYRIVDGQYVMPDADNGVIRTENILCDVSESLCVTNHRVLRTPQYQTSDFPVAGLEDCRLRQAPCGIGVSATIRNVHGLDGRCRIATADLDCEDAVLSNLRVMSGRSPQDHEKNWMPFGNRWLYSCSHAGHVVTVEPDPDLAGGWQLVQRGESPPIAKEFRGGTQLVPCRGGWLCLVHEVAWIGNGRAYEHRFVWFDERLVIRKVSRPFAFREPQAIEFAAGLAPCGESLVIAFGVRDAEAWMAQVSEDDAWRLLYDL